MPETYTKVIVQSDSPNIKNLSNEMYPTLIGVPETTKPKVANRYNIRKGLKLIGGVNVIGLGLEVREPSFILKQTPVVNTLTEAIFNSDIVGLTTIEFNDAVVGVSKFIVKDNELCLQVHISERYAHIDLLTYTKGEELFCWDSTTHYWSDSTGNTDIVRGNKLSKLVRPIGYPIVGEVEYDTLTDFLKEYGSADIDYNSCMRWYTKEHAVGQYSLKLLIVHQRKETVKGILVKNLVPTDYPKVLAYLKKHWVALYHDWSTYM